MSAGAETALLREYEFSDQDFQRVRALVREQIGISLADSKRELVYGRLSRRLRALGLTGFHSYLRLIEHNTDELQQLCNAITTNLTAFFRERHHFDYLTQELLPALERDNADSRRIRIWSAGCSTGEEAYSIAMVLLESLGHLRDWDIRILATDVDTGVLKQARRGVFSGERLEKVDSGRLVRWFTRIGDTNHYRVCPPIKQLVAFKFLNMVGEWPMHGPFDVIFCRNVVIYFDRDTQRQIISRMAALQRAGDHLVLGHSESLLDVSTQYRLANQTIYRRRADGSGQ
jgi:chemotaxis protein methyltransferase CheR